MWGKADHCPYCVDNIYRRTPGLHGYVEVDGCKTCHNRHMAEVDTLKAKLTSLEGAIDRNKSSYELELSKTLADSSRELLRQKTEHEREMSELALKSSFAVDELTADNNQQRKKAQFLQNCRDSLLEEDVVLATGPGLEVTAHCTVLAAKSSVFKRMVLYSKSASCNQTKMVIEIEGVPHPVLEAVVDFLYSGEITFSDLVRADEVLEAAHHFELGFLRDYCDVELCRALTVDNVPRMLKLARKFEASRLQEEAGELFKEHFDILKSRVYEILEGPDN